MTVFGGLALALAASAASFLVAWLLYFRLGRVNVVDTVWGLSFVAISVVALLWARHRGISSGRQLLVLVLVAAWGLRLATYLAVRSAGKGEDPRYARMLATARTSPARYALTHVIAVQALIAWFVSFPVVVAMCERSRMNGLAVAGGALWALGFFFEAVGDAQLAAFKRDPANKTRVLDSGLWRYTRHPNYFGEACMWTGLYLVAAQHWQGALTILSPAAMTWFVAAKTGKPLLEAQLTRTRPGYRDYVARTSGFLPLPPRNRDG